MRQPASAWFFYTPEAVLLTRACRMPLFVAVSQQAGPRMMAHTDSRTSGLHSGPNARATDGHPKDFPSR